MTHEPVVAETWPLADHDAFLTALHDRLRTEADPDVILRETTHRLALHLGASRTGYGEFDDDALTFFPRDHWTDGSVMSIDEPIPFAAFGPAIVASHSAGELWVHEDLDDPKLDAAGRAACAQLGIVAVITVPVLKSGRLRSLISVQQSRPRHWHREDVALVEELADRTWAALERARAMQQHRETLAQLRESEEQFRTLAENMPSLCYLTDPAGRTYWGNRRFYDFFQGTGGERGDPAAVVHPDELATSIALWTHALSTGEPAEMQVRLRDRGGVYRPFLSNVTPIRDIDDVVIRWCGVLVDLSAIVAQNRRHSLLRRFADTTRDAVDVAAIVARAEALLAEELGVGQVAWAEAADDPALSDAPTPAGRGAPALRADAWPAATLDRLRSGETVVSREGTGIVPPGPSSPAAAVNVPLVKDGRLVAVFSVGDARPRDWSDDEIQLIEELADRLWAGLAHARAQAALIRSREALYQTEKLSALGSLLAGVSHELNNPLSIIVAQAELLELEAEGTPAAERAGKIRRAAERSARIVQTFLAMARQKAPDRAPLDLNDVVRAALELTGYGLRASGITVRERLSESLPQLMGDADQLHQVVANLIVNAQHAMQDQRGERLLTVTTLANERLGTVSLDVADTGVGIPRELHRRIFEPFFTTKAQDVGTGIGLSFSQGVVEAHQGRLEALDSKRGALFRMTLPSGDSKSADTVSAGDPMTSPLLPKTRTALVVDDEVELAESLADILSHLGFAVTITHGGRAAISALEQRFYDLIVTDLRMPDVDGVSLFEWIGDNRSELVNSVVFTSGDTLSETAVKFLSTAKRPFLEKPFTLSALRLAISG